MDSACFVSSSGSFASLHDYPFYSRHRSSSFTKMVAPARRQSCLASGSVICDQEDNDMAIESDSEEPSGPQIIEESPQAEPRLHSPFLHDFASFRPAKLDWPSLKVDAMEELRDKQFNSLNPTNLRLSPTMSNCEMATDDEPPVTLPAARPYRPSTPTLSRSNAYNTPSRFEAPLLHRAKSSPSLRSQIGFLTESHQPQSVQMESAASASFNGLGVMLPDTSPTQSVANSDFTSPIARGPVRRAVVRRGSLMPKPKTYLRVQAQLAGETSTHADVDEMLSEAAVRRQQSSKPTMISLQPLRSTSSSFGLFPTVAQGKVSRNRFPESAPTEDDDWQMSSNLASAGARASSDSDEMEDEPDFDKIVMASTVPDDANSVSQLDMDEEQASRAGSAIRGVDIEVWRRERDTWLGFRNSPNSTSGFSRSLGNAAGMDVEQTPAVQRNNKRKLGDVDRFEPYSSMAFKRRAVSPTSSLSPALGSPILANSSLMGSNFHSSSSGSHWAAPKSRGSSPVPASATSGSASGRLNFGLHSDRNRQ